ILLTWTQYDQYIQQIMQINAMWKQSIDFNIIYVTLNYFEKDVNETFELLSKFKKWKFQDNNKQKYKKRMNKFVKKRCCNHNINLFSIFLSETYKEVNAVEYATVQTVNNCLPFVKKNK
ncbi:hypothetical protein RFI_37615, partial [Reticulomyxa filosa]